MTLTHPISFVFAMLLIGATVSVMVWRGRRAPIIPLSALFLAIAAGGPTIHLHPAQGVTVVVDVSPSTRGALFRSRSSLMHRVDELVRGSPIRWVQFSDHNEPLDIGGADDTIAEMPSDSTRFVPAEGQPVLLFSDGQFDTTAGWPRIYPVVDPLLSDTHDAAVRDLSVQGDDVRATVNNDAPKAVLRWTGVMDAGDIPLPTGSTILTARSKGDDITARVIAGDRWPENDSLSVTTSSPSQSQRWWVGNAPPVGWKAMRPSELPTELSSFLNTSLIVLNNVPAKNFASAQLTNLQNYVRHLGGGLLIIGGDHAFAAGGYSGTELQNLSPLSGYPPTPNTRWTILLDRSGSMATESAGVTRLQNATTAVQRLIPHLPPNDRVSVGEFADTLTWLFQNSSISDATNFFQNRKDDSPSGPTNLQSALQTLAANTSETLPTHVIVVTDGETPIERAKELSGKLLSSHIRVDMLLLASAASGDLLDIVKTTGGRTITVGDGGQWAGDLQSLAETNSANDFIHSNAIVHYLPDVGLADRVVDGFNPTWLVDRSVAMTVRDSPRAARWQIGAGVVGALAFEPTAEELAVFEKMIAASPSDPDLQIDWTDTRGCRVAIEAPTNILNLTLALGDLPPIPVPLLAPGHYETSVPTSTRSTIAVVRNGDRIVARHLIAGRYPREFDRIGNDLPALQRLADRTGGILIAPNMHGPIDFHWPEKAWSLGSWFAAAAAILIGIGCILRRT